MDERQYARMDIGGLLSSLEIDCDKPDGGLLLPTGDLDIKPSFSRASKPESGIRTTKSSFFLSDISAAARTTSKLRAGCWYAMR